MIRIKKVIALQVFATLLFLLTTPTASAQTKRSPRRSEVTTSRTRTVPAERVDRRAKRLNRATAFALIQEFVSHQRQPSEIWDLNLIQIIGPSKLPEEQARMEFCNALVKIGILSKPSLFDEFNRGVGIPPFGQEQKYETAQRYRFSLIERPGFWADKWGDMPLAKFELAGPRLVTQVIRIYQEEGSSQAQVWATIVERPSDLYLRLKPIVDAITAQYGPTLYQYSGNAWRGFPEIDRVSKEVQVGYGFTRFDDGWRVTG